MDRNINVIQDLEGNNIVIINDIRFKGKRSIDWDDVKKYLEQYVGDFYEIAETKDIVYIGKDLPDEYTGSKYTYSLKGAVAKAKANAAQGIKEMIINANDKRYTSNKKSKHSLDAVNGWYRYETRFAIPVIGSDGEIERYNVFHAYLIIRHDKNKKKYLYDIINIKKETSNPLGY